MNLQNLTVLLLILIFVSCSNSEKSDELELKSENQPDAITSRIEKMLGNNFISNFNSDSTYSIVSQKNKKSVQISGFKFIVINNSENTIIFEDFINDGSVNWKNDSVVTVSLIPGMIKKDEESVSGYNLNVRTLEKTKKVNK